MFLLIVVLPALAAAATTADFVLSASRIYTMEGETAGSAIAVKDGRVLAVGDDLRGYIGANTKQLRVEGGTVLPGFIDSHAHMSGLGESLEVLDLRECASADAAVALVRKAAAAQTPGSWIRGRAWDQTRWPGGAFPDASELSAAAPDNPVFLTRVDGHAAWVNHRALKLAGVTASTPEPPGGKIHRTASGEPSGILIDRAQGLVASKIPPPTPEQIRSRLEKAAVACAKVGLTTVHDAGVSRSVLDAYRELIDARRLPVRVYAMIGGEGELWREYLRRGPEIGDRLTVRSIKLMGDGALGSRGAALKHSYSDDPGNNGLLLLERADIERVARNGLKHGFQVNTHAIGDRANRTVLEAYGAVLRGKNDARFRVEHAQVVSPEDFDLFREHSVIAAMQATHATSDMRWAEARLGKDRVRGAYAWRRFLSIGVPVANGSDFPVEDADPLAGFFASVTRQDKHGWPEGGWQPDQRMTRKEALRSWTWDGAYAAFEEKQKGSLAPGKLADFVVLSRDILRVPSSEVLETRVLMTVLGGEIVHSAVQ